MSYSSDDLEVFREKIRDSYTTDYINHWNDTLGKLNIAQFRNIDDAVRVFAEIDGPSNPFGRLIQLVKAQTEIYDANPMPENSNSISTGAVLDKDHDHGLRIARSFADLAKLMSAPQGKTTPFEELSGPLSGMETYLRTIQSGENTSKPVALE